MTADMVPVTNLTPPGSDNPSRAYGQKHRLTRAGMVQMTASVVRVTNRMTPGSANPTTGACTGRRTARVRWWETAAACWAPSGGAVLVLVLLLLLSVDP
jgi:hypothetical protein